MKKPSNYIIQVGNLSSVEGMGATVLCHFYTAHSVASHTDLSPGTDMVLIRVATSFPHRRTALWTLPLQSFMGIK